MVKIETEITIDKTPTEVFAVLTDLKSWKEWNPFIVNAEGIAKEGETLKLTFNNKMVFTPKVLKCEDGKEFRWLGKLGCGYIFDGEHRFTFEESNGGKSSK